MKTNPLFRLTLATVSVVALAFGCGGGKKKGPGPGGWAAAVGDQGTLVETFGDAPWTERTIADVDLYAVSCVNNRVGWAVGKAGKLVHTVDGGKTWVPQVSGVTSDLKALAMAIRDDGSYAGVAVGDSGALLVTNDGTTWRAIAAPSVALRGAATSEGATLLLASGDAGTLLRSEDSGATWTSIGIGTANVTDVALDATGSMALAVDDAGSIWQSTNRAAHFGQVFAAAGPLESASLGRSGSVAVASGASGLTLVSTTPGSFSRVASGTDADLHAALVGPSENELYLAGEHGTLVESQDFGRTWDLEASGTSVALRSLEDLEAR